jgi:predicted nucleic acid-binding protein
MTLAVIDASVAVEWLLRTGRAPRIDSHVAGHELVAPEVIDAEFVNALRKRERLGLTTAARATQAVWRWVTAPVERVPHLGLVVGTWRLRHNLSACDAMYVTLAQSLDCQLVTTDRRLAAAPDLGITVTVVA